ncbi:hypothetical protein ULF88_24955 [Halopseudomonas pachastrellae]|nr:hypothetical protein [Halopseudomonas pachastrellae]
MRAGPGAKPSRQQNISLLAHKKEIFDAFYDLKDIWSRKRNCRVRRNLEILLPPEKCKIYLPSDLAEDIEKYYNACFWISEIRRRDGGLTKDNGAEFQPHLDIEKKLAPKIEKELVRLLQPQTPN